MLADGVDVGMGQLETLNLVLDGSWAGPAASSPAPTSLEPILLHHPGKA